MLTDEQIKDIGGLWAWINMNLPEEQHKFARTVEAAACADRDARIAELERQLVEAREMLKDIYKLLRRTPPTTRNMYVGASAVPWGKQASDIAKMVKEAIDAKAKP